MRDCVLTSWLWANLLASLLLPLGYTHTLLLLAVQAALFQRQYPNTAVCPWLADLPKLVSGWTALVVERIFTVDLFVAGQTVVGLVLARMVFSVVSVKMVAWLWLTWRLAVPLLERQGITVARNQQEGYAFLKDLWATFKKDITFK
jgi:hypothetical protein